MLRKQAKTKCTFKGVCCVIGGMVAYMQLGVALFIHANIQPYVAANFFKDATASATTKVTQID